MDSEHTDWAEFMESVQKRIQLLEQTKSEYEQKIRDIHIEVQDEKNRLYIECSTMHGGHELVTEREQGPYGERFTYCKRCGYQS